MTYFTVMLRITFDICTQISESARLEHSAAELNRL